MNTTPRKKKISDDLIRCCMSGDRKSYEIVYSNYSVSVYNIALRYTRQREEAEDLTQEIFIKVFKKIGQLKEVRAFEGWFYRIALNTCLNYSSRILTRLKRCVPWNGGLHSDNVVMDDELVSQRLETAIRTLSPKLKHVFILHDVEGFTHHEIGNILGCSEGTSKSQLFKARKKLRKCLKKE